MLVISGTNLKQQLCDMNSRCAFIVFSILFIQILHTFGANETTERLDIHTTLNSGLTTLSTNYTTKILLSQKNQTNLRVLIVNSGTDSELRIRNYGPQRAKSLRYEERDDKSNVLSSFVMHDLDDVTRFFNTQLETKICYVRCPGDHEN